MHFRGTSEKTVIYSRKSVLLQLTQLLKYAIESKGYPSTQELLDYIISGPNKEAYPEKLEKNPVIPQWDALALQNSSEELMRGIFGQRRARFDNRCVSSCRCIPQFKCASRNPEKKKNQIITEAGYLLQILNLRFTSPAGSTLWTPGLLQEFADEHDLTQKLNRRAIDKWLKPKGLKLAELALCGDKETLELKTTGRAAFSRPAAIMIKELILSGLSPTEFHQQKTEAYRKAGIFELARKHLDENGKPTGNGKPSIPEGLCLLREIDLQFLKNMRKKSPESYILTSQIHIIHGRFWICSSTFNRNR